ncbi:MAG: CPBP family intramembrane glutamic endopeptidase [Planctomycetota bacterium]
MNPLQDLTEPEDGTAAAEVGAAAAALRPAFVTWLLYEAIWGAFYLASGIVAEPSATVGMVAYVVTALVAATVVARQARIDHVECRLFARPRRGMVELCLIAGIGGSMLLAMLESRVWSWHPAPLPEKDLGWPIFLTLMTAAALPAVVEELLFRGVILQRLRRVLTWPLALAIQAMLFAVMHLDGAYVLPHFAFGCLAGFLRIAARALWPCLMLHFLWNTWLVFAHYGWL